MKILSRSQQTFGHAGFRSPIHSASVAPRSLSEATQKAQMHPESREEAGQQDEPGVALSPDGPGASPEPPSLTHTPEGNTVTDTLASDLLRKLAGSQSRLNVPEKKRNFNWF